MFKQYIKIEVACSKLFKFPLESVTEMLGGFECISSYHGLRWEDLVFIEYIEPHWFMGRWPVAQPEL